MTSPVLDSNRSRSIRSRPSIPTPLDTSHSSCVQNAANRSLSTMAMAPPHSTIGQLSFAPATKTTVVTTTTTTTTSFPPFIMKAPKHLIDRDPEQYPLASTPTPRALRRLHFDINGRSTYFEEADDTESRLQQIDHERHLLRNHNGTLRSVNSTPVQARKPSYRPLSSPQPSPPASNDGKPTLRRPSATPISTPDATELDSFHLRQKNIRKSTRYQPRPLGLTQDTPVDTDSDVNDDAYGLLDRARPLKSLLHFGDATLHSSVPTSQDTDSRTNTSSQLTSSTTSSSSGEINVGTYPSAVRNTLVEQQSLPFTGSVMSPLQDASLPSPSLSPITAAANLHQRRYLAGTSVDGPKRSTSMTLGPELEPSPLNDTDLYRKPTQLELPREGVQQLPTPSFTDIPGMLDSFDSMPEELKSYVMYQLLRRCQKSTLQFVSNTVNPALRCDFLNRLPLELSLNIVQYLDFRSMCRAASVSKRWRNVIDSDEKSWKALLVSDGFNLPADEMERAVRQGWGWHIFDFEDWLTADENPERSSFAPDDSESYTDGPFTVTSSKRKRKTNSKPASLKRQRRKSPSSSQLASKPYMRLLSKAQGPHVYANAAILAVPNPQVGLPSLQNLHLFKSIYQRHYTMKQSWMQPDSKPLHLAFKAHQRHVVTCLQFDGEKILTGSDDSNIDIYETSTGRCSKQLQGHDGGVWALEYQDDLLVSGSTDRTVRVWDMRDGRMLHVFQGHTSTVRCLQIVQPVKIGEHSNGSPIMMPRQPLIITGSRDSTCRVWKLPRIDDAPTGISLQEHENPYFVRALIGHGNSVRAIAAHGDTLVSGSYDSLVRVWQVSNGECIHILRGHSSKVYSVVLDHERARCISGSMDNMVKVWSIDSGVCLFNLDGHTSLVGLLDLRSNYLVSAAADATLRVWDPETGYCKHILSQHTGAITCFLHDGQKIISGSDRTLKMWDTQSGECVRDLLTDLSGVWQIKFDDRRCVAAVQRDDWTYIEVLDFGAAHQGTSKDRLGRRIVVDGEGQEIETQSSSQLDLVDIDEEVDE